MGGTVRPRARAVVMLRTSANLLAWWTGTSLAWLPLKPGRPGWPGARPPPRDQARRPPDRPPLCSRERDTSRANGWLPPVPPSAGDVPGNSLPRSRPPHRRVPESPRETAAATLRIDLIRRDAENSEPEMASRSAQFLPVGAIPLDGRSKIRNALHRGEQLLEELKALSV